MLIARPEDQILICVARRSLDVAAGANLRRLLRRDLDWNYLLLMAERHRVVASLYYHLVAECPEAIPSQVRSRLEKLNQENTRSNLLLTGELLKIIELLEARGIAAVPFKGPTLALWAYGDVGRREFGDLDILVKKPDVPAIRNLLVSEGFTPRPELNAVQQAATLRFDCSHNRQIVGPTATDIGQSPGTENRFRRRLVVDPLSSRLYAFLGKTWLDWRCCSTN